MAELVIRLVCSLAVVVGLLLLTARLGSRRFRGRAGAPVTVLHRQPLTRGSTVTVVSVGSRVLVLGTTEQHVNVLAELEPGELDELDEHADLAPVSPLAVAPDAPDFAGTLLRELSPAEPARGRHAAPRRQPAARAGARPTPGGSGRLAGSVLSAQTWRAALSAVSGRAS
jgi:flagellar protein FliO/FliZ